MNAERASLAPSKFGSAPDADEIVHFRPSSRRRRTGRNLIGINIAPMIDMTFLLLIFFVVTMTFEQREGMLSSRMPNESAPAVPLPIKPIIIGLESASAEDPCAITLQPANQRVPDFAQLFAMLVQLSGRPGFDVDTPVVIRGEPDTAWQHVVNAWNAAVRAGYTKVAIAGS